jgi:hypothetical protein
MLSNASPVMSHYSTHGHGNGTQPNKRRTTIAPERTQQKRYTEMNINPNLRHKSIDDTNLQKSVTPSLDVFQSKDESDDNDSSEDETLD